MDMVFIKISLSASTYCSEALNIDKTSLLLLVILISSKVGIRNFSPHLHISTILRTKKVPEL